MKLNIFKAITPLALAAVVGLQLTSCTDMIDESIKDPQTNTVLDKDGLLAKIYSSMVLTGQKGSDGNADMKQFDEGNSSMYRRVFEANEMCADESIWTWQNDAGIPELTNISWNSSHGYNELTYYRLAYNITLCNHYLEATDGASDATTCQYRAEVRFIRALMQYYFIDLYGKMPYTTTVSADYPLEKGGQELFDIIVAELESITNSDSKEQLLDFAGDDANYGRADKVAAKLLLARLYLNAKVYTGTEQWAKAKEQCEAIMNSGHFHLTPTYAQNFAIHNEGSTEAILAIPYSSIYTSHTFYPFVLTLNEDIFPAYNITAGTWNGTHMGQPDFMARYDANDTRKTDTWLFGDIYDSNGQRVMVDDLDAQGKPIKLPYSLLDTPIPEDHFGRGLDRMEGARFIKWPYQTDGSLTSYSVDMENDFILMRYADVVLMYVECLLRDNKAVDAAAVPEFQQIRTRAGLAPIAAADLNLDSFFEERQKEMALEGWVHNDLVRFDKYLEAWWAKPADSDPGHILLPIPEDKRSANPNLNPQNPGY